MLLEFASDPGVPSLSPASSIHATELPCRTLSPCPLRKQLEVKVASRSLMLFKSIPLNEPSMVVGIGGRSDSRFFAASTILCKWDKTVKREGINHFFSMKSR